MTVPLRTVPEMPLLCKSRHTFCEMVSLLIQMNCVSDHEPHSAEKTFIDVLFMTHLPLVIFKLLNHPPVLKSTFCH